MEANLPRGRARRITLSYALAQLGNYFIYLFTYAAYNYKVQLTPPSR